MEWAVLYDFATDARRVEILQAASLDEADHGLSPDPALVGSEAWWKAVEEGRLPRVVVEGTISRVVWGSSADWPEFELKSADSARSTWTREGDITRYVEGLQARVTFAWHPWKRRQLRLGADHAVVILVEVEESPLRSAWHPGPMRIARGFRIK